MAIFLEEQIRVSKEERIEMTAENISQVVQGQSKLIEEGKYKQPAEGVDEGRPGKEVHMIENEANGERSQLQLQEIQTTEDLHNVEHLENEGTEGETEPQVSQYLHAEEHS